MREVRAREARGEGEGWRARATDLPWHYEPGLLAELAVETRLRGSHPIRFGGKDEQVDVQHENDGDAAKYLGAGEINGCHVEGSGGQWEAVGAVAGSGRQWEAAAARWTAVEALTAELKAREEASVE